MKQFLGRLDPVAIATIFGLSLPLGLLLYGGDHTYPKVQSFSWQAKSVGAEDTAFILTFNRPMNWDSVAKHLAITPPLPGQFSSSGRRFVYTLRQPIPYGTRFQLDLHGASEQVLGKAMTAAKTVQPFSSQFRSHDLAFVYIGVGGAEDGRLVLHNLTQQYTTLLTPKDWVVTDFKLYPEDRILFGAVPRTHEPTGTFEQKLYTVSTGLNGATGPIKLLLSNTDAQILKFDVSANGHSIVLQRYSRSKTESVGLWVLKSSGVLRLLKHTAVGDFLVTPDGSAVAIAQNQGISIVPISIEQAQNAIEYLPQLGVTLGFSRDASAATMMKFNPDATRSLVLVTQQGIQKALLRTNGFILKTQFDPTNQRVFCLYTQLEGSKDNAFTLYIDSINLTTLRRETLVALPGQSTGHMSLAPDGSQLLFDAIEVTEQPTSSLLRTEAGQAIATSRVWTLPLFTTTPKRDRVTIKPSELSLSGMRPIWVP